MSKARTTSGYLLAGLGVGGVSGYVISVLFQIYRQLSRIDVHQTLATHTNQGRPGKAYEATEETGAYVMRHTIEDGIERVVYTPKQRRFETPIVMQHGMWHGAWCWSRWQALLAEWGWESHAHSLPGHAGSPVQRPLMSCTLDYYLAFLKDEVLRQSRRPVLMGHSMGGALTQWYLKYVGDDLPAAVLVAPWESHQMMSVDSHLRMLRLIPQFYFEVLRTRDAWPMVSSPERAAQLLISDHADVTPEELFAKLGTESMVVLFQHNPPFWYPPDHVQTPLLWIAGSADAGLPEPVERRSAEHYYADYFVVEGAGHDVMLEKTYRESAERIHRWLVSRHIP
ncbi:MAG: alpha/beta hydrolase [Anaerolineae bacterium]|nr:alpha/beta hydrolase [Anaerolineae bacterium]